MVKSNYLKDQVEYLQKLFNISKERIKINAHMKKLIEHYFTIINLRTGVLYVKQQSDHMRIFYHVKKFNPSYIKDQKYDYFNTVDIYQERGESLNPSGNGELNDELLKPFDTKGGRDKSLNTSDIEEKWFDLNCWCLGHILKQKK